jgi:CDP-diacylglycerol--glycerol-3-phosphate 3-phosphatidyltransferase
MKHVPNALTILRILVTPLLLYLLYRATLAGHFWALTLFVFAAISDWLDGKLARHYAVKSRLGQYLDPMADKILVLGTFIVLAIRFPELVPWWAVLVVASRDVAVTVLRSVFERRGLSLRTSSSAKWKTAAQLTYLIAFLLTLTLTHVPGAIGRSATGLMESTFYFWSLLAVAAITVYTGIQYFMNRKTEDSVTYHA